MGMVIISDFTFLADVWRVVDCRVAKMEAGRPVALTCSSLERRS